MLKKWKLSIPELTGSELRRAYIYLPESYEYDQDMYYPVMYMFDGHNIFLDSDATYGKSWGMKDYMDETETQMIIVAVECNHSPDHGRLREYSPFDFNDPNYGHFHGMGDITMNWMVNTLKREIDRCYRTRPEREYTFIGGSSMGGLMSIYAAIAYNHVFGGAAALSPSIWVNMTQLTKLIREAQLDTNTIIYMDYGANEINFHPNMRKQFRKVTKLLLERDLLVTSRIVPDGDHCETCWEKQLPYFMHILTYSIDQ